MSRRRTTDDSAVLKPKGPLESPMDTSLSHQSLVVSSDDQTVEFISPDPKLSILGRFVGIMPSRVNRLTRIREDLVGSCGGSLCLLRPFASTPSARITQLGTSEGSWALEHMKGVDSRDFLLSGNDRQKVFLWDCDTCEKVCTVFEVPQNVRGIRCFPDVPVWKNHIFVCGYDGSGHFIGEYDLQRGGVKTQELQGHPNQVWALAAVPTTRGLFSGGNDATVKLWHPQSSKACIQTVTTAGTVQVLR